MNFDFAWQLDLGHAAQRFGQDFSFYFELMFVAGVPVKYLFRLIGGMGILIGLLLVDILFAPRNWQIKLEDYQRHRLLVYFGRDFAPRDATPVERKRARELQQQKSYHVEQALISVGVPSATRVQISSISESVTAIHPSVQSFNRCAAPNAPIPFGNP